MCTETQHREFTKAINTARFRIQSTLRSIIKFNVAPEGKAGYEQTLHQVLWGNCKGVSFYTMANGKWLISVTKV